MKCKIEVYRTYLGCKIAIQILQKCSNMHSHVSIPINGGDYNRIYVVVCLVWKTVKSAKLTAFVQIYENENPNHNTCIFFMKFFTHLKNMDMLSNIEMFLNSITIAFLLMHPVHVR